MKLNLALMIIIVLLLLFINFLTFHDILEPHTFRDWLILLASVLVIFSFARTLSKNPR